MANAKTNTTPTPAPNAQGSEPTAADLAAQKAADATESAPAKAAAVAKKDGLMVAVNLIVQTGTDGLPETIEPGVAFYPAKADLAFLMKNEAVREPTATERVMHEHVESLRAAAAVDADETLG